MKLIVATLNRGKFREISEFLRGLPLQLIPFWEFQQLEPVIEDQPTFQGNALKKARAVFGETGLPTLADDSGLVVDALGGRPGVFSARYAGEKASDAENLSKLLREMESIQEGERSAHFVCAMVLRLTDGREFFVEERCDGEIARKPGGVGGFGYDPIFFLPEFGKTMAEISPDLKNQISHRGKALQKMKKILVNPEASS
ncbi:MAG: RdgB/HAM1 family non-canonical purine NTP pyrophosphatase [Deltaproteobacteria bacterium]|nr:RdgB/HAM1 family non-canonical purine NTP pyrophosphatase [Deltaproteobacteria bacterium]